MTNSVRISKCCPLISLKTTLNKGWTNSNHVSVINERRETRVTQTGIYIYNVSCICPRYWRG